MFLGGKIKCGYCGYAMILKYSAHHRYRYFRDTGSYIFSYCDHVFPTIYAEEVENSMTEKIKDKIRSLSIKSRTKCDSSLQDRILELKLKIEEIDKEIDQLVAATIKANDVTMDYINRSISSLHGKKDILFQEINELEAEKNKNVPPNQKTLQNAADQWDQLSMDDKIAVVDILIEKIIVRDESIEIQWKV